jgi:hypothetical protein
MSDNYLWDKSGEPDEEIQQLESLLSEFRYNPRPLSLPEATPKPMIFAYPSLRYAAIAAVALLALGVGIWLSARTTTPAQDVAETTTPTPSATPQQPVAPSQELSPEPAPKLVKHLQPTAPKVHFAKHTSKRAPRKSLEQEGEEAKEKVLYALQLTSEKLNLIAKKIQTDTN